MEMQYATKPTDGVFLGKVGVKFSKRKTWHNHKRLANALLNTNKYFSGEIRKIFCGYPLLSGAMITIPKKLDLLLLLLKVNLAGHIRKSIRSEA